MQKLRVGNDNFEVKASYKNDGVYSVEVFQSVDFKPKTFWYLWHSVDFQELKTVPTQNIYEAFDKILNGKSKAIALQIFDDEFIKRKKIKSDEWYQYWKKMQEFEKEPEIASSYFTKEKGSIIIQDFTKSKIRLKMKVEPDKFYLQGFRSMQSVNVVESYRKRGIARAMYLIAEKEFNMKIVPSSVLTPNAILLHRSLNKIY